MRSSSSLVRLAPAIGARGAERRLIADNPIGGKV